MNDDLILEAVHTLMSEFSINVGQIQSNSDNTKEDLFNEAVIVVVEHYPQIQENPRVFINELKKRCLKFNKYGRRIESKARWQKYNQYEEEMVVNMKSAFVLDEDSLIQLIDIQALLGNESYDFLINYYSFGADYVAQLHNISTGAVRKRVHDLIKLIKKDV